MFTWVNHVYLSVNSFTDELIGEIAQPFAALISQKQQNLSYLLIRD